MPQDGLGMEQDHSLQISLVTPQVGDAVSTLQAEFVVGACKVLCKERSALQRESLWEPGGCGAAPSPARTPTNLLSHQDGRQCFIALPGLLAESHHPWGFAPVPGIS